MGHTMCFSATASFTAGVALSAVGIVTIKKTRTRSEIPLAAIPLVCGIQQLVEGFVWLSLGSGNAILNALASNTYYVFANVWWPIFLPLAVLLVETVRWRKNILLAFEVAGIGIGAYFAQYILTNAPITSRVLDQCIVYSHPTWYIHPVLAAYVIVICIGCLVSSKKIINVFGMLLFASLLVTYFFYTAALVSVWCFFAGLLSMVIYTYFTRGATGTRRVR